MKLGDAVEVVAQPVARGLDHVLGTNIQGCQGCQGRKQELNNFSDSVYDFFWKLAHKKQRERSNSNA